MSWAGFLGWSLIGVTIAVGVVAGQPFSPYFDPMLFNAGKFAGRSWPGDHPLLWYGSIGAIAALALAVAALPAALVWRFAPRPLAALMSSTVWLAATTAIAWPALRAVFEVDD